MAIGKPRHALEHTPLQAYRGQRAVLATMHGKQAAITPIFFAALGLLVDPASGLDTDVLGTFTGETPRSGSMKDTALVERIGNACPMCQAPGHGQVDVATGLPCAACGSPTELVDHLIHGCAACAHREAHARPDGRRHAEPAQCFRCNP